jgi:hypothetical protein
MVSSLIARRNARSAVGPERGAPISWMGWLRIGLRGIGLIVAMLICVPLHYLYRIVHYGSPFPRLFLLMAARVVGARIRVHGVPLKRDVFYISNHLSWVDILAVGAASGSAFVAKAELANTPIVGWLALPFKTSMLRVLEPPPPGVLVQPVVLDYGRVGEWIGWIGTEDGVANGKRILSRRGSFRLEVHFLEPFDPRDMGGRKAIAAEARSRIEPAVEAALGEPLRPFAFNVAQVGYVATDKGGI